MKKFVLLLTIFNLALANEPKIVFETITLEEAKRREEALIVVPPIPGSFYNRPFLFEQNKGKNKFATITIRRDDLKGIDYLLKFKHLVAPANYLQNTIMDANFYQGKLAMIELFGFFFAHKEGENVKCTPQKLVEINLTKMLAADKTTQETVCTLLERIRKQFANDPQQPIPIGSFEVANDKDQTITQIPDVIVPPMFMSRL